MKAAEAFRQQGEACAALGSRMYAELLCGLVRDIEAQGPTWRVLRGHEDDPGPSGLALRMLGSVHRLVLERRAGGLAAYFPSVGGHWDSVHGVPAYVELLDREGDAVRAWLDRPPQTNEVGRSSALMGGLLHLPERARGPVRLLEIGCSAGLNLLADRFSYVDTSGTTFGAERSPVQLRPAWRGNNLTPWADLEVVEAVGCDLNPLDATTTEGRLALTAYVWPDLRKRLERLRGALELARIAPPEVRRRGAGDFVADIDVQEGATTVVWHSVMWQYLSTEEQERTAGRIETLGEGTTGRAPLVHLSFEPTRRAPDRDHAFLVVMTTWPGGERRILGRAPPHGVPVTWETG